MVLLCNDIGLEVEYVNIQPIVSTSPVTTYPLPHCLLLGSNFVFVHFCYFILKVILHRIQLCDNSSTPRLNNNSLLMN